jgi:protein-disulfide isomerase
VRPFLLTLALAVAYPLLGFEVDPRLDRALRGALPVCGDVKISYAELPLPLPDGFQGAFVKIESSRPSCAGRNAGVLAPSGAFYVGMPWPIGMEEGSIEEKLKSFTWRNLREVATAEVDRTRNADGLFSVTLLTTTEDGKVPMHGFVDPEGQIFFFGQFRSAGSDVSTTRARAFESLMKRAPSRGNESAPVVLVEFSDFQCPSCKYAAGYADSILARFRDKVRYVRFDLPLTGHSWSFAASLAGRAIYQQSPELFWDYKAQVYENQESLNAFTIAEWARTFAEDRALDMERYDADVASPAIRQDLLSGTGLAFSNDIRATPTFMINGALVDPGDRGTALASYVDKLLKN